MKASSEQEQKLIEHLRKEAFDIKHCFTQYTFQGLAFVAAVLGVTLKFYNEVPEVGLVGVPLTLLLTTIASIGIHKYTSANRIAGYELHLQRVARYPDSTIPGWHPAMREMGWEEALRAWRIFQATVMNFLYEHGNLSTASPRPSAIKRIGRALHRVLFFWRVNGRQTPLIGSDKKEIAQPPNDEWWFETRSHLGKGMAYSPGGYIQTLLNVIYLTAGVCVGFALIASVQLIHSAGGWGIAYSLIVFPFAYWTLAHYVRSSSRRLLLEEGLLSINSCAVLWQVISCAHFWTLHDLSKKNEHGLTSYANYSATLGKKAVGFCDKIDNPYEWYATVPIHQMLARANSVLGEPSDLGREAPSSPPPPVSPLRRVLTAVVGKSMGR